MLGDVKHGRMYGLEGNADESYGHLPNGRTGVWIREGVMNCWKDTENDSVVVKVSSSKRAFYSK